jgi:large subunit ribosomal protein L10
MPSRDELIAKAVGSIASPLRGLVTVLSGVPRGLVTALSAIADKKKEAA